MTVEEVEEEEQEYIAGVLPVSEDCLLHHTRVKWRFVGAADSRVWQLYLTPVSTCTVRRGSILF